MTDREKLIDYLISTGVTRPVAEKLLVRWQLEKVGEYGERKEDDR